MKEPIIICLETGTAVCSVALFRGKTLLHVKETTDGNKHSQWLTSYIDDCMQTSGVSFDQVDAVAVSQGPGSYTGLRVGYATAKGICVAKNIPLIEVSTLKSLYFGLQESVNLQEHTLICPMIDARRMEVYWQTFDEQGNQQIDIIPLILPEQDWAFLHTYKHVHFCGNGAFKMLKLESEYVFEPHIHIHQEIINSAQFLIHEAIEKYNNQAFADIAYAIPFYLKNPNITTSKKQLF